MNMNNSDQSLQEDAALTNALILNSSWNYDGDNTYNLAAASYDAAARDALPESPARSRCCLCFRRATPAMATTRMILAAGNRDSIQSPATAKNVLTVGAIQERRDITNLVTMRERHHQSGVAGGDEHGLPGGQLFQPRQRGHWN